MRQSLMTSVWCRLLHLGVRRCLFHVVMSRFLLPRACRRVALALCMLALWMLWSALCVVHVVHVVVGS